MNNFKGYYIKTNGCTFNSPAISRQGLKISPHIVQVTDAGRVASGKLIIKELPHRPTKITIKFPIMTEEQYRTYYKALDSMYLSVEYYNESSDKYETGTFYHTDLTYQPVKYQGQEMILFNEFSLIEH